MEGSERGSMNDSGTGENITILKTEEFTFVEFLDPWRRRVAEIIINYVILWGIAVSGVISNSLVITVYCRQGFRESVSISMTTIAVWDMIKCLAGTMDRFSSIIGVWNPAAALSWSNISVVVFNYLTCFSSYVTSVMASYVAVERCLCVSMPLKVKWMLTRRVTLTACLFISVVVFGCFAVMFGIYDVMWIWDDNLNATVAIYQKNDFYTANETPVFLYYNFSGILWPLVSFIIISTCTIIIVYKLRQGSKFRSRQTSAVTAEVSTSQQKQQTLSSRDKQVVKMLLVIIVIYIICLFPRIAHYIAKYVIYDFYYLRKYHHLFSFVSYWILFCDFVNGAVNFFVFYAMSTSFRETFGEIFSYKEINPSGKGQGHALELRGRLKSSEM